MREEIWKPVKDYESLYEISNLGRLKSMPRQNGNWFRNEEKILPSYEEKNGYEVYYLSKESKVIAKKAHRLVAEAFLENPTNRPSVNHKDGNKKNNEVYNLEWCSIRENNIHAIEAGLKNIRGKDSHYAKVSETEVKEIIRLGIKEGKDSGYIQKLFPIISRKSIQNIIAGRTWNHIKKEELCTLA